MLTKDVLYKKNHPAIKKHLYSVEDQIQLIIYHYLGRNKMYNLDTGSWNPKSLSNDKTNIVNSVTTKL